VNVGILVRSFPILIDPINRDFKLFEQTSYPLNWIVRLGYFTARAAYFMVLIIPLFQNTERTFLGFTTKQFYLKRLLNRFF
jgi:hypothetical protein